MYVMKIDGVKVKNAKTPALLHITANDIKRGTTKSPEGCAAALACKRQLHAQEAMVHRSRTYVKIDGEWWRYRTSAALRSEIVAFDRGGSFAPGSYAMHPSPELKDRTVSKSRKSRRVKVTRPYHHYVAGVRERMPRSGKAGT